MSVQQETSKTETVPVLVDRTQLQDVFTLTDSDAESFADLVAVALAEHEDRILYQEVLRTWDEYDPDYVEGHRLLTAARRRWSHCRYMLEERFGIDREERSSRSRLFDRQRQLRGYMSFRATNGDSAVDEHAVTCSAAPASADAYSVLRAMRGIPDLVGTGDGSQGLFLGSTEGEDGVR